MIDAFATSLTVRAVGWALVQSLWQGALIGVLTALTLAAIRRSAAKRRYAVACVGLTAILAVSMVTAVQHARELQTTPRRDSLAVPASFAITDFGRGTAVTALMASRDPSHPPATVASGRWWWRERLDAWSVWVVPVWLLGVLVLASRLVAGWFIVERIRRAASRPVSDVLRARVQVLAARLRLTGPLQIVESAVVTVPMVIGWLRPVILLPGAALTGLSPVQLEAVVAHELAHIRRHDYLINLLQTTAETLLFYHPASWWISRQIRAEREHCCDDVAVDLCGDRVTYARALVDLEAMRQTDVVFALAATAGPLTRRIRRLLSQGSTGTDRAPAWMVVGVVLAVVSLAAMRDGESQAAPSSIAPGLAAQTLPTVRTIGGDESGVRGRVVDVRSGAPLTNAMVELSEHGGLEAASTDAEGRYEARVRPGEYRVFVRAAGYIPTQYGQRQPSEEGTTISVGAGQIVEGVDVPLQPAGVLSGRIFDESGASRSGVEIELLTERYLPGGPVPVPAGFAQTDASGAFRIDELPPGGYYVRAYVPANVRPRRGDGTQVYGSTYYPGATRLEEAQPIHMAAGQEVSDVDLALAPVTPRVVTGRLVDTAGPAVHFARVVLMAHGGNTAFTQTVPVAADGSFVIRNVVPSRYMLMVQDPAHQTRWVAAARELTVDDDVSGVEIVARRGGRLEGRMVRDGGGPLPFDPRTIRVGLQQRLESRPGIADWVNGIGESNIVQADGTFTMDCPGGSTAVQVSDLPPGWTVKAIHLDGTEITDQATDFGDGVRRDIEIVLTDRVSGIVGVVTDRNRRVVPNYTVLVFPQDEARRRPPSRLVRHARSRQDGSYQLEALPPADYLAIALDSLPQNAWIDPRVLERLEPGATRFRLDEGAQGALPLTLSPTPADLFIER